MSKHTPGPWNVGLSEVRVDCDDGTCFVIWPNTKLSSEEIALATRANARLIAAAPELLSVLEELQESASYWSEYDVPLGIVDRINAAIAKAKGETHG